MHKRASGAKLVFYDLHGGGFKVQVMADARYTFLFSSNLHMQLLDYGFYFFLKSPKFKLKKGQIDAASFFRDFSQLPVSF